MKTLHLIVDANHLETPDSQEAIERAAQILRSGGLVAFPTETVYGLGANALNEAAVASIFSAKRRPRWDPLIVHISDDAMLRNVAKSVPACGRKLMDAFWPGPLTLLVPRHEQLPPLVTAGRYLVGVRMPAHPVALALIRRASLPIAAPSANLFGHISPTSAAHVFADLDGRVDAILDAGETLHGLESTVVDTSVTPAVIYRPGVITADQIAAVCGSARIFNEPALEQSTTGRAHSDNAEPNPSPGMGERHYAPKARLVLIEGEDGVERQGTAQQAALNAAFSEAAQEGERVGLMLPTEFEKPEESLDSSLIYNWGSIGNLEELAHNLFAGLRYLDNAGATIILCPLPGNTGLGIAIRDRLKKAAR